MKNVNLLCFLVLNYRNESYERYGGCTHILIDDVSQGKQ